MANFSMCRTCGDGIADHPADNMIRFEWAETARPDGWWYYRTPSLENPSYLRRNHKYKE